MRTDPMMSAEAEYINNDNEKARIAGATFAIARRPITTVFLMAEESDTGMNSISIETGWMFLKTLLKGEPYRAL